jgi:hypothetical protein
MEHTMSVDHTLDSLLDPKHVSAIADALREFLKSHRKTLKAMRHRKGVRRRDRHYLVYECNLNELRRCMATAGYFKLRDQLHSTAKETITFAALQTLAEVIGESTKAPLVASESAPLLQEDSAELLADVLTDLAEFLHAPPQGALGHGQQRGDEPHPDGVEGGCWLWWKNKRHPVPRGVVYRLFDHMWDRDSASYEDLEDAGVFESAVAPQTVRSYANKAKNALPSRFPWRLKTDSTARQLTKFFTAKGQ